MPPQPRTALLAATLLLPASACGDAASGTDATDPASTTSASTTAATDAAPTTGADASTAGETGADTDTDTDTDPGPADAPDYEQAFPQDRVPRLDITLAPAEWQAMLADMTDMLGEFGAGMDDMGMGGPMGMMPDPAACAGLAEGDACETEWGGEPTAGTCTTLMNMLLCIPEGVPPPMMGGGGGFDLIPRTPVYVECDVAVGDDVWHHVGVRFKGNSSLASGWRRGVYKLPLRLNFDKFEDDHPEIKNQRFYGFESLSLSNGSSDPSLIRDKVATDLFADAGVPAPASAFYRVFVDHGDGPVYFGLYTGIELPEDESFLDRRFGGHDGNLYKPDGDGGRWDVWDPESLGKENHEDEADYSDAQALFDALHADRSDPAAWRAGLEARLDVDGFLHWLALNAVVQDWDQYGALPHNYYLYADPAAGGRFSWITWDHSFAFMSMGPALSLGMEDVGDEWPLIRFLLDDPVYGPRYRELVGQAAADEYTPALTGPRFAAAHALIAPYAIGPDGEIAGHTFLESDAAFTAELDVLLAHAEQRQQDVAAFLEP